MSNTGSETSIVEAFRHFFRRISVFRVKIIHNNSNNNKIIKNIKFKNKKDKICLLIDVAIPSDRNVIQKESENKLKYKILSIEIQPMWNMKCFVILVIIGATGFRLKD
jgi:hypothetical protein